MSENSVATILAGFRAPRKRRPAVALLAAIAVLLTAFSAAAAPLEKDLGEGLAYFRAHALPEDLPAAAVKSGPIVLDLRFVTPHENAETALDAWLKFRATPPTPVFVLLDSEASGHFARVLAAHRSKPGFLTLGKAAEDFTPDIAIDASPDEEKKAYDALEKGASLSTLISENADKPRNDEAALTHAHANFGEDEPDSDFIEVEPPKVEKTTPPLPVAEPVIDHTLQRAVQVHRGLLALKRLERPKA